MRYEDAYEFFGWPARRQVFEPSGAGARVYADQIKRKIAAELRRRFPSLSVEAGVLAADPNSDSTEAPIAIVCEFPNGASDDALKLAHRLAWNFARAALLITLEPHRLLAWTCWVDPRQTDDSLQVMELRDLPKVPGAAPNKLQASARDLLHWVSLITGDYLRQQPKHFRSEGRADALLLENLKVVRRELLSLGLEREYCHDLLARIIFAQFLFHRKDSEGRPFLDRNLLEGRCEGALRRVHRDLGTILEDGEETYRFFRWLDERFNGDLFPGKENQTDAEREEAWRREREAVTRSPEVLRFLAHFVSGSQRLKHGQLTLWPLYSFDTIPLEFISSAYEEFLTEDKHKAKAYYTPPHLVDFVLDAALPWNDEDCNLRILDPCCGSGIFLVKAFQRVVHRWRRKHAREPLVSDLKPILANNFWGVDRDPEAVRVACFSLYLAMADAIEPRYYLKREKVFPRLRGVRLLTADFFDDSIEGIRTPTASMVDTDKPQFDLAIGNAPWGDNSIKDTSDTTNPASDADAVHRQLAKRARNAKDSLPTKAEAWAAVHGWPVANHDIGPLFLAKGAALLREGGQVAMVQPAPPLLYQRAGRAMELRKKLFTAFAFSEITNLSAIRRDVFAEAIGPACIVVFRKTSPDPAASLLYFHPRPSRNEQHRHRLIIEPYDANQVTHQEAADDPLVWSLLALGGRRDMALVQRLRACPTIEKLKAEGAVESRLGVIPGDRAKAFPEHSERRYFDAKRFPDGVFRELDADTLPKWTEPRVASSDSTTFGAFKKPQLLVKQSLGAGSGRFSAVLVKSSDEQWGVICKKTYLSVHDRDPRASNIQAAWIAYNSRLAAYYLALTSSRIGHYITETLTRELLQVPLPPIRDYDLASVHSLGDVDTLTRDLYRLSDAEWVLVDDFLDLTLPAILRKSGGQGDAPTARAAEKPSRKSELEVYGEFFVRVLKATFGRSTSVCATVMQEPGREWLPVRMVAIHLDWPGRKPVTVEVMEKNDLFERLRQLHEHVLSTKARILGGEGLGFQRVAFLFHAHVEDGRRIPSLYIIKPDQRRYWTRSLAMRDADELAALVLSAANRGNKGRP